MNSKEIIRLKLKTKSLLSTANNEYMHLDNSKQKIVVALAADYGNLGDVAITFAQTEFLRREFPEAEIIDFPISDTFTKIKSLKKIINKKDIITIVGGGNTGDMYDDIEYSRQFIIQQFPKNKIISFPQTIDFSDTKHGKKAFKRAVKVYGKHRSLTLVAREEKSYNIYQKSFKNRVVFSPDIVLSLNMTEPTLERKGITFCMRKDEERRLTNEQQDLLINSISNTDDIKYNDTHIDKNKMSLEERITELKKIWNEFKASELVITDRLHGMIFCAITGTPCIALDNSNAKVSGLHEAWLEGYNYISVFKNFNLKEIIKQVDKLRSCEVIKGESDFSDLKNILLSKNI